jgi:NurA-like 5'-3' nuclease
LNRKDDVLNLLSSIEQHISATAYPLPGYPLPLQIAHDKVTLRNDRTQMLERALRTKISPEALEFLTVVSPILFKHHIWLFLENQNTIYGGHFLKNFA